MTILNCKFFRRNHVLESFQIRSNHELPHHELHHFDHNRPNGEKDYKKIVNTKKKQVKKSPKNYQVLSSGDDAINTSECTASHK